MAFTATIQSINFQNDAWQVVVLFADSASGWQSSKNYQFAAAITQAQAVAAITADGQIYKSDLNTLTALQSKVGTVITI